MRINCRFGISIIFFALAACGDAAPGTGEAGEYETFSGEPPGGTLIVLAEREPDELNPLTYGSNPASHVTHLLFRTLARRDSTLTDYAPDLARSWELGPDSTTLTLHLRDDVRWHDGRPVTANDVVFTIERQSDERVASPRQADVAAVLSAMAVDSVTVEVEFTRPGPYTVNALLEVMPVPEHILGDVPPAEMRFTDFARNPVGNGLYRLGSWRSGQSITLAVNDDAPDARPAVSNIVLRFVPDLSTALTELIAGQGDLLKITPEQRDRVAAAANVELHSAARVRPAWIAWNTERAPVDDVDVRRAVLMGIDREALVAGLFGEDGEPALSPIPPGLEEHSEEVRPIPHDPDGARELLEDAGWIDRSGDGFRQRNGQRLRLEVDYIATDATRRDVLIAVQAMLRRIGVELVPRSYESTAWVERLRSGDFQGSFWGWGWGPGVVGTNAEMILHSRSIPPNGPNFAHYRNTRVDALLDSALVEFDPERSSALWREIEQEVIDDAVYAPLYLDPELFGVHERFAGVRFQGIEWWEDVHEWYVPADRRLGRDR